MQPHPLVLGEASGLRLKFGSAWPCENPATEDKTLKLHFRALLWTGGGDMYSPAEMPAHPELPFAPHSAVLTLLFVQMEGRRLMFCVLVLKDAPLC